MEIVTVNKNKSNEIYALWNGKGKPFQNNMRECHSIPLKKSDIVADIGAYIGEFSVYCARYPVKKVYSYEPTPNTFKVLSMNALPNMELKNVAIVGDKRKTVDLFLSKGIGVTNSIKKALRKAGKITVPALQYEEALKDATIVKIDCEGAEYEFNIIQPQLRAIILEFHPIVGWDWQKRAKEIIKELNNAGFKTIMEPTFKSGWGLTGSWLKD